MNQETFKRNVANAISVLQELEKQDYNVENDEVLKWKNKFIDLVQDIEHHLENAEMLYEDMKKNELSLGTAEAEGYLRGARYMMNIAKEYQTDDDED